MKNMYTCRAPESNEEFDAYYQLRWQVLRQPWHQEKGSEQDTLEGQSYHRLVVDEQGNIVATGRLHMESQFIGQIRYMAVADNVRGKGVGQLLLTALEQVAAKVGINTVQLNARESALSFYSAHGYLDKASAHTLYNEVKHRKMEKRLLSPSTHLGDWSIALSDLWHKTIPMSKAMNMQIAYYDQRQLITHCDLLFNKNLHNTMFAGSIYTLATLTGWAWVYFSLKQQGVNADIVLAEGNIRYLAPLAGVAYARTSIEVVDEIYNNLASGKNARLNIAVEVCCGDSVAAVFKGSYVAVSEK